MRKGSSVGLEQKARQKNGQSNSGVWRELTLLFCTPIKNRTHAGPRGPEPTQQNLDVYISAAARVNLAFRFFLPN